MLEFTEKIPIHKGWSGDKKYRVTAADGAAYLLRITPFEDKKSADRKELFTLLQKVAALGVPMCLPLECGESSDGIYTLYSWIDGSDAETAVPLLKASEQYSLGLDAGRALKLIHTLPAPDNQPEWESRFNKKIDRKITMYANCPLKYENGEAFLQYIKENRRLLKNRPQCFQHGDYHIGNMMLKGGQLVIIDFASFDFGDPWEEFNRIVRSAQSSPLFASGTVDGYFDNAVPREFWQLLALYIASNTLSSLPWALSFGEKEITTMKTQAAQVLDWYDGMTNPVPGWYKKP